jgi:hypothetical protein
LRGGLGSGETPGAGRKQGQIPHSNGLTAPIPPLQHRTAPAETSQDKCPPPKRAPELTKIVDVGILLVIRPLGFDPPCMGQLKLTRRTWS